MNINETRHANLIALIGDPTKRGSIPRFAKDHNLNPDQVRQLVSGSRTIGEKVARKLEESIGLQPGALDKPLDVGVREVAAEYAAQSAGPDAVEILRLVKKLSPGQRATAARLIQALADSEPAKHQ